MAVNIRCLLSTPQEVAAMLAGLQKASESQLRASALPRLYASGVRYRAEPFGQERWQLPAETFWRKHGDCEDLAAWRAAELVVSGVDVNARAVVKRVRPGLMHCLVLRGDRVTLEDPSALLGMKGKG